MSELEIIGQDINCETGEVTPIYLTPEIADMLKKQQEEIDAVITEQKAKETEKAIKRQALLDKLGLTQEEAEVLFNS